MLDKTIPYQEFWMYLEGDQLLNAPQLPRGLRFSFYSGQKDAKSWQKIETAVGEFDRLEDAADYFERVFAPFSAELSARMLFVENEAGEKIATCTAWWQETTTKQCFPIVHWLAVLPEYQGKKIAKALLSQVLTLLQKEADGQPIYLHTQTWSHPAVRLYRQAGFKISTKNIDGTENSAFPAALAILQQVGAVDEPIEQIGIEEWE